MTPPILKPPSCTTLDYCFYCPNNFYFAIEKCVNYVIITKIKIINIVDVSFLITIKKRLYSYKEVVHRAQRSGDIFF